MLSMFKQIEEKLRKCGGVTVRRFDKEMRRTAKAGRRNPYRERLLGARIWGARGSLPRLVTGQERHGGNTVCLEILHKGQDRIIFDAGTGIANLGDRILDESPEGGTIHLFLSHYHWDHIMGLPFFGPIYRKGYTINLYGLESAQGHIEEMLHVVFSPSYSPIYSPDNLLGNLCIPDPAPSYQINDCTITTTELVGIHPGGFSLFKLEGAGKSLCYASDVELREPEIIDSFVQTCRGYDLLFCNGALSQQRFEQLVGWGHSSLEVAYSVAHKAGIKQFVGIHFDPLRSDDELDRVCESERNRFAETTFELAREGDEVWVR